MRATRASYDESIDKLVTQLNRRPVAELGQDVDTQTPLFMPTSETPWIEALEKELPRSFPPSFRSLVCRYRFPSIELGPIRIFSNTGKHEDSDLCKAMFGDASNSQLLLREGFLQIGRSKNSYDPICFSTRNRKSGNEYPVVRIDHEMDLRNDSVPVLETVSDTFIDLILRVLR